MYFQHRLEPALRPLLDAAVAAGRIRGGVEPGDLLRAVANLCVPGARGEADRSQRMVELLLDGLRYGAPATGDAPKGKRRPR